MAIEGDEAWLAVRRPGTLGRVLRLDLPAGDVVDEFEVDLPAAVKLGPDRAWVASYLDERARRVPALGIATAIDSAYRPRHARGRGHVVEYGGGINNGPAGQVGGGGVIGPGSPASGQAPDIFGSISHTLSDARATRSCRCRPEMLALGIVALLPRPDRPKRAF